MKIITRHIPFLPKQIDQNDLHENGKLLSDKEIDMVLRASIPNGKTRYIEFNNHTVKLSYAIIKMDNEYYAIYSGAKSIGTGGYGRVKVAQNIQTGTWLAIKIQKSPIEKYQKKSLAGEVKLLKKIGMLEYTSRNNRPVIFDRHSPSKSDYIKQHYMLMHYAKGETLEQLAGTTKKYPPIIYLNMIISFLQAAHTVHKKNIIHRDIKLNNIIYDPINDHCELIDFGLSIKNNVFNDRAVKEFVGARQYIAPELWQQLRVTQYLHYNKQTDIYAIGVTIRQLLHLDTKTNDSIDIKENIISDEKAICINNQLLLNNIDQFTKCMINKHPKERPTLRQAIEFFQEARDALSEEERTIQVALLDISALNQYLEENPSSVKKLVSWLKKQAKQYHVLWLINPNQMISDNELAEMKQSIEQCGFWVAPLAYYKKPLFDNIQQQHLNRLNTPGRCLFSISELHWQNAVKNEQQIAQTDHSYSF